MGVAEKLIEKLDNEDIVFAGMIGGLFLLIAVSVLFMVSPYATLGLATLAFLAWAGIRIGWFEEEEEDPIDVVNRRYANDEISEREWKKKRDQILETNVGVEQDEMLLEERS